ncbi:MAG: poly(A) polymerase, partial [Pseudobdellovibrio sp.]
MTTPDQAELLKIYSDKLTTQLAYIDSHAIQILKRLKDAKFQAYLVGGGVRDLLVDLKPKDFDIATNALPQEVKRKVPNSFIIGRRFKLVHARRGELIYEIATFRRAATHEELETTEEDDRRLVEENFFGNIEEDSFRRDFTINSLYYDPIDHVIVDHCNGIQDIHLHVLRMIGSPEARLIEDPIRILRAIRLSQKLNFSLETNLREQIRIHKAELKKSALPRRREEWLKFLRLPQIDLALMELFDLGIFEEIMPSFHQLFLNDDRREEFLSYLRQFNYYDIDFSDNTELFSAVLISYIYSTLEKEFKIDDYIENEKFLLFCRDELGVFKAEVGSFFQSIQFINPLKNKEHYLKKGERRQRSLVSH